MTPSATIIHRYRFLTAEVVEALGVSQDCLAYSISIDAGGLVVDVVEPGINSQGSQTNSQGSADPTPSIADGDAESPPWDEEETPAPEPELKGGPLAQRASICCGEGSFRLLLGVQTAEDARAEILRRCGITTRKMLDHDDRAAAIWRAIDGKYRLWLDGHDVELD